MSILHELTKAISSGIALFRVSARSMLPGLYVINRKPSGEDVPLVYDGDYPYVHPHAYGEYLDLLGSMFGISRHEGETDEELRVRILFYLSENSTRSGITRAVKQMFQARGFNIDVDIRENHNDFFDGTTSTFGTPLRSVGGSMLYGMTIVITPILEELHSVSKYNHLTGAKETFDFPSGVVWHRRNNPYTKNLIQAFQVPSLEYLLEDIVAAGINVDRVVVQTAGAGGVRAPIKATRRIITENVTTTEPVVDMSNVLTYEGQPLVYDDEYLIYS